MAAARNILITAAVALAACVAAFGTGYVLGGDRALREAGREGDAMAWLRAEFRLAEPEFAAIRRLHEDFSVECGRHCAAIIDARERRAPADEVAALERTCVDAMGAHFRKVAALMPAAQGERYLALVLPRLGAHPHHGAPNLRAAP
jgi:predicted secreted protein